MPRPHRRSCPHPRVAWLLPLVLISGACAVHRVEATKLTAPPPGSRLATPVRAHLADGSTVVFRGGATFEPDTIRGAGEWWAMGAIAPLPIAAIGRDHVVAAETFRRRIAWTTTLLVDAPLIALYIVAAFNPVY